MKTFFAITTAILLYTTGFAQTKAKPAPVSAGKVEIIENFKSKFVEKRNVEVYLPAEYFTNPNQKFPVLYMQDGQNVFNPKTSKLNVAWEADSTADKLIAEKRVKPIIIVAVWYNEVLRYSEYFPEKAAANFTPEDKANVDKLLKQMNMKSDKLLGDEYLKFLTGELKPYIDKKYRTLTDAPNTAICGSSLGALLSLYAICEYPNVFGEAACVSTHWPVLMDNSNMAPSMTIKKYVWEHLPDPKNHRIYFDYGTAMLDQYYEVHQKSIDEIMKSKGYTDRKNWVTKKFDKAAHLEKSWQERFDGILEFLFVNNTTAIAKKKK